MVSLDFCFSSGRRIRRPFFFLFGFWLDDDSDDDNDNDSDDDIEDRAVASFPRDKRSVRPFECEFEFEFVVFMVDRRQSNNANTNASTNTTTPGLLACFPSFLSVHGLIGRA